jgi:two-component system sensor histidine kinase MprB
VNRLSLASRVTLLATVAVGLAVALASVAAYFTVDVALHRSLDQSLLARARAAASSDLVNTATLRGIPASALGAGDVRVAVVTADGKVFYSGEQQPPIALGDPELAVAQRRSAESIRTIVAGGVPYRVVAVPAEHSTALVLAQSQAPTQSTLRSLGLVLLLVGGVGVVAAGLAGWAVARSGLRPVRRLTDAAEEVARTDQLRPIEVTGTDEIARLSAAFNSMLTALAASRDRQRRLVADAGHELRTPLTSLRTNLDLVAQADREGGMPERDRAELLADVRAQVEELSVLVGDLVELARDEPLPVQAEPVDLGELTARAVDRVRRRAPGLRFDVCCEPWYVVGDGQSLERAVTNLLDNAAKWSPPGGVVSVRLAGGQLCVADQGPGISETDLPHVFERFYRSREARTLPGSGLGLAIVRQAAQRHGGWVRVGRAPAGGAALWLAVPGSPVPPTPSAAAVPASVPSGD